MALNILANFVNKDNYLVNVFCIIARLAFQPRFIFITTGLLFGNNTERNVQFTTKEIMREMRLAGMAFENTLYSFKLDDNAPVIACPRQLQISAGDILELNETT